MALSGGAFIFLAFELVLAIAVGYSLYTKTGSGISQHPWRNGTSSLTHDETTTSIWRGHQRKRPKTTASTRPSPRRP